MQGENDLAVLRELLSEEPSRSLFLSILKVFVDWEDDTTLEVGLGYAEAHLSALPDDIRYAEPEHCWPGCPDVPPGPALRLVRHFYSYSQKLGDEGAELLASSPDAAQLKVLRLYHSDIGDYGIYTIANSPYLEQLEALFVYNARLTSDGARTIARSSQMSSLALLNLFNNDIGDKGAKAIAASPHLTHLKTLHLEGNGIGRIGVSALCASTTLTREAIDSCLSRLRVDDEDDEEYDEDDDEYYDDFEE